jgi:uncharacterized protein YegL
MNAKVNCLPVYVMIDTSQSMNSFESMLNEGIESLYDELITSPRISDFAYVSIISFNTEAEVVMEMTDLQSMNALPQMTCGGITYFNAAIALLRQRIDQDVPYLKNAGRQVLRPVAFLLTDGVPTDKTGHRTEEWRSDYKALVSKSYANHPNVVPFGYGQASPQFLMDVATLPNTAFLAKDGGTEGALKKVIPALLNTLIASANDNALSVPTEVDGYIRVSNEFL